MKKICALLVLISLIFVTTGCNKKEEVKLSDAEKFHEEYQNVEEDNVFVYRDAEEIIKILEGGTGIVYLGFPECKWCQAYTPILNEVAKENGIKKIFYFNILEDRKNNTKEYQRIVELLEKNLLNDDEGNKRVYVPDVSIVINGEITNHDNETSVISGDITPEEYWTKEKKEALKKKLNSYVKDLANSTFCKDGCN